MARWRHRKKCPVLPSQRPAPPSMRQEACRRRRVYGHRRYTFSSVWAWNALSSAVQEALHQAYNLVAAGQQETRVCALDADDLYANKFAPQPAHRPLLEGMPPLLLIGG